MQYQVFLVRRYKATEYLDKFFHVEYIDLRVQRYKKGMNWENRRLIKVKRIAKPIFKSLKFIYF